MRIPMTRQQTALLSFGAALLVVFALLYVLKTVLLTLVLSGIIAYVLAPVVRLLERTMPWRDSRPGLASTASIAIVFLAVAGAIASVLLAVIPPTIDQGERFVDEFPEFVTSARSTLEGWADRYVEAVPEDVRIQIEDALSNAGDIVGAAAWRVVQQTLGVVTGSFGIVLGLATAPVLIYYLLKDSALIGAAVRTPFPGVWRAYVSDVLHMADRTLGGYLRGQLTLGLVVGFIVMLGLLALDIPFAVVLGVVAGLTELVPIIGPWIGGAVGVLVTLATAPEKLLWVVLLYVGIQLLENTLLVPRIQASTLDLHPVGVILTITLGSHFFGLWGVILGPPLVSLFRSLIIYFLQQWHRAGLGIGPAVEDAAGTEQEETHDSAPSC